MDNQNLPWKKSRPDVVIQFLESIAMETVHGEVGIQPQANREIENGPTDFISRISSTFSEAIRRYAPRLNEIAILTAGMAALMRLPASVFAIDSSSIFFALMCAGLSERSDEHESFSNLHQDEASDEGVNAATVEGVHTFTLDVLARVIADQANSELANLQNLQDGLSNQQTEDAINTLGALGDLQEMVELTRLQRLYQQSANT
jgi:hypothetical protein